MSATSRRGWRCMSTTKTRGRRSSRRGGPGGRASWSGGRRPPASRGPRLWPAVEQAVRARRAGELVERATLLGLPVAALASGGEVPPFPTSSVPPTRVAMDDVLVVDFSSLWAGPLCTRLLRDAGARVVKV